MTYTPLIEKAETYLQTFCVDIPNRRVGSRGNQAATDVFASTVREFGLQVETPTFDCIDWEEDGAELVVGGTSWDVHVSPYTLGGTVRAPLTVVSTLEGLEAADLERAIVLLRGEIAREPLMPKNFPFYNPERHQRIVHLLETKRPQAILAATSRNPELAGAVYPFPFIEDGDVDIPSVYMTEDVGAQLADHVGEIASLEIRAHRTPAEGCNVIARQGATDHRKIVVVAHIDAKDGTPGALDNAAGTTVLLLLAELMADAGPVSEGDLGLEIVALNGEDYYSNPGQLQYLGRNEGAFDTIALGVNLDGVGYHRGRTAYSLYNCPSVLTERIEAALSPYADLVAGEPWYQGDHALFLMHERPALAMTSERVSDLLSEIVHTPKDRPEIVDAGQLVAAASALRDLIVSMRA
jgi:aminopeptidase YwaD